MHVCAYVVIYVSIHVYVFVGMYLNTCMWILYIYEPISMHVYAYIVILSVDWFLSVITIIYSKCIIINTYLFIQAQGERKKKKCQMECIKVMSKMCFISQ